MDFVGWEKLSLVDYDDNLTTTLFMAGCPFRCPFCHNSSLVIKPNDNVVIPWEEILSYLKERKNMLDAVTITGGEPTLMNDLEEKCAEIKRLGYLVKLDTNGVNPSVLKRLIEQKLIDYIAMDIKNGPSKYALTVGLPSVDMNKIKESIKVIMDCGLDYEFRTTLVNEFHDMNDIHEIASLIKGAKKYFLQKYVDNGNCIENGLHEVSLEQANSFKDALEKDLPFVCLRGY